MTARIKVVVDPQLREIMPRFLEIRAADVEKMRLFLEKGDLEGMRYVGHSMKGSGEAYGFVEISRLGAAIEQAALGGDSDGAASLIAELDDYLSRLDISYSD